MVKEFNYTSANGTKTRKVFVVTENDNYIGGFDLNLLTTRQANTIVNKNVDFIPTATTSTSDLVKHVSTWDKAYRNFTKSKMVNC